MKSTATCQMECTDSSFCCQKDNCRAGSNIDHCVAVIPALW